MYQGYRLAKDSAAVFECPVCLKQSENWDSIRSCYREHERAWDLDSKLECPLCHRDVSKGELTCHFETEHAGRGTCCCECRLVVEETTQLRRHMMDKHANLFRPRQCQYCGYSAHNNQNLTTHINRVHENKRDWLCTDCGIASKSKPDHSSHMNETHIRAMCYRCPHCHKDFPAKRVLAKHLVIHLPTSVSKPYICSLCGYAGRRASTAVWGCALPVPSLHGWPLLELTV